MSYEEYDDYDDVYGKSVEDECISPTDASQWIYDRNKSQASMNQYMANHNDIQEEEEGEESHATVDRLERRDSENYQLPDLDDESKAKLMSCMDEIRDIIGFEKSDKQLVETIMKFDYDCAKALDCLLTSEPEKVEPLPLKVEDVPVEKGFSERLFEMSEKQTEQPSSVLVTPVKPVQVTRGFDITFNSRLASPDGSGRASPANSTEIEEKPVKPARNAQELFNKERGDSKQQIHMVVIGHVDAGKSTLMGHLLFDLGAVSQKVMHKNEQESKKIGKQSFMYAWVLDETGEERSRGITMDVGSSRFETTTKWVTLLDAPGHKDFIPNMISGANQADVALLVVDATRGEFETGFEQGGQTREHALLVRSLGVSQLGVVINKLDTVNWSKERFEEIVNKLKAFLKQAGFKDSDVTYVPCSGLTGENLVKEASSAELKSWYNGPNLISVIDSFKIPERSIDKPFRMSINDVYKGIASGFLVSGRIESGLLCTNDKVLVCPSKEQATVKQLSIDEMPTHSAFAGDQVAISLSGIEMANISVGYIICDPNRPIPLTTRFRARIVVFNVKNPITLGYPVVLHHQSLIEPATIVKLKAQLHKGTGEVVKKNPRCLGNNSCALIEIETSRPICMERYADFKELGRVMLRVSGITIAAGLVTDILK